MKEGIRLMISCSLKTLKSLFVSGCTALLCIPWLVYWINWEKKTHMNGSWIGTVSNSRRFRKVSTQKYAGDSLRQSFAGICGDLKCVRVRKAEDGAVLPVGGSLSRAHKASPEQPVRMRISYWFLGLDLEDQERSYCTHWETVSVVTSQGEDERKMEWF